MGRSRQGRLWLLASVFLAAVPVMFGLIRAVNTGSDDVRYLWLAGAAILGSMIGMPRRRGRLVERTLRWVVRWPPSAPDRRAPPRLRSSWVRQRVPESQSSPLPSDSALGRVLSSRRSPDSGRCSDGRGSAADSAANAGHSALTAAAVWIQSGYKDDAASFGDRCCGERRRLCRCAGNSGIKADARR